MFLTFGGTGGRGLFHSRILYNINKWNDKDGQTCKNSKTLSSTHTFLWKYAFILETVLQQNESESHPFVSDSLWPHGLYSPWNSPGQNSGLGSLSLLQGIFPTQGLNPGLPHCRQNLYQVSHKGNPRILEWVAYPFSRGSSRPRNWIGVSCIESSLPTEISGKSSSVNHGGSWKHQFIKIGHFLLSLSLRHWTKTLNQGSHPNLGSFTICPFFFPFLFHLFLK